MTSARPLLSHRPTAAFVALTEAARDSAPVAGLTHNFYRYPARFSPKFVRAAIETFSDPGDLVLDPFMGGGTTLVEAVALGRHAVGTDISSLATFVAEVKTTIFSDSELDTLERWAARVATCVNMHNESRSFRPYEEAGYYRHLDKLSTWRLRKAIEQTLNSAIRLRDPRLDAFARCVTLRTAQWALDGRERVPSVEDFRASLTKYAKEMIEGARSLRAAVNSSAHHVRPSISCLNRSTVGLENDTALKVLPAPRLVLTSPPYPGIHVLYHRWQVEGGKETPAPFWIANRLDGSGAAYYTMGDRKTHQLLTYFDSLRASLQSVAALCTGDTAIVQVVAFSEPSWQLPRYLSVADDAGLVEYFLPNLKNTDCRLWRSVPNRRWYSDQRGDTPGSQEVVLFHRKRK